MSTHLIGSTVLMALVLVAIYVGIARVDRRQATGDLPARREETAMARASRTANDPARLGVVFVVLTLALGVLTLGAVGGAGDVLPSPYVLIVGLMGVLLTGFLFLGSYVVVRQHGLGHAQGVAAGLLGVGGVGTLVVVANLVFQFV